MKSNFDILGLTNRCSVSKFRYKLSMSVSEICLSIYYVCLDNVSIGFYILGLSRKCDNQLSYTFDKVGLHINERLQQAKKYFGRDIQNE